MSDEQALTDQQRADKLAAIRMKAGVKYLMGTRAGRHLAWNLLGQFGVFHEGFSDNPLVLARSSGRRSAGLQLLQLIDTYTPEQYGKMTAEAQEDAATTNPNGDSK